MHDCYSEVFYCWFCVARFQTKTPGVGFVKIHAPWHVLCREAEFMKLKMPTKKVTFLFKRNSPAFFTVISHRFITPLYFNYLCNVMVPKHSSIRKLVLST